MLFLKKLIQFGVISLILSANHTVLASEKLHPWGEMALMDLKVIQQTIRDHHVGPVDPENPGYKVWLNDGYQATVEMAKSVVSFNDYTATISHYTDGFDDGHITFYRNIDPTRLAWPNFTLQHLAGKTLIVNTKPDTFKDIQQGDQLISCDGKSVKRLMAERVYPYQGISGLEAETIRLTPYLLVSQRNTFVQDPKNCIFSRNDKKFEHELSWSSINYETLNKALSASDNDLSFTLKEIEKDIYRISLPTFNVGKRQDEIVALLEQLKEKSPQLLTSKALIFDVRGNSGGSSGWAIKVIDSIFGKGMAARAHKTNFDQIVWRVSQANIDSYKYWQNYWVSVGGENDPNAVGYGELISGMSNALKNKEIFFNIKANKVQNPIRLDEIIPKIYLLTDSTCFSACLGMADIVMSFPQANHIGSPTRADAIYIDNRKVELPSGNGTLSFSMKVYRGRVRGHNEPYIPNIPYLGDNWSTKALDNWFVEEVWSN